VLAWTCSAVCGRNPRFVSRAPLVGAQASCVARVEIDGDEGVVGVDTASVVFREPRGAELLLQDPRHVPFDQLMPEKQRRGCHSLLREREQGMASYGKARIAAASAVLELYTPADPATVRAWAEFEAGSTFGM
jgi:hypothetical protein